MQVGEYITWLIFCHKRPSTLDPVQQQSEHHDGTQLHLPWIHHTGTMLDGEMLEWQNRKWNQCSVRQKETLPLRQLQGGTLDTLVTGPISFVSGISMVTVQASLDVWLSFAWRHHLSTCYWHSPANEEKCCHLQSHIETLILIVLLLPLMSSHSGSV